MTIKLDGKPLSDFGIDLLSPAVHPAAPQTRDMTVYVPGRAGVYHFGSTLGERNFSFECGLIRELDTAELQRRLRELVAFLLDAYARPREIRLTFDYEPDKYYAVKFVGQITPERFFAFGSLTLTFTAFDPFAYADMNAYDSVAPDYDNASEGDFYENTKSFSWTYSNHYSGVYNHAVYATDFILSINGTANNPSITHLETNKKLILPSITNQIIEIDSSTFSITVDGVSNLSGTDFFSLVSGGNGFLFEGESPNATVTYKWKHKFL